MKQAADSVPNKHREPTAAMHVHTTSHDQASASACGAGGEQRQGAPPARIWSGTLQFFLFHSFNEIKYKV